MSLVCSHQGAVQAGHMCTEFRRVHWAPVMPLREWLGVAKLGEEVATSESRPYPSCPKRLSGALPSKVSASDCILPGSRRSLPLHTPRDREFTPFSDRVVLCLPSIASAHTPPQVSRAGGATPPSYPCTHIVSVFTFIVGQPHHAVGTLQTGTGQPRPGRRPPPGLVQAKGSLSSSGPLLLHPIATPSTNGLKFQADREGAPMPW